MRSVLVVVMASLLFTGCIQTERRYDVRTVGDMGVFLVDRERGCVWFWKIQKFDSVLVEDRDCADDALTHRLAKRKLTAAGEATQPRRLTDDAGILNR